MTSHLLARCLAPSVVIVIAAACTSVQLRAPGSTAPDREPPRSIDARTGLVASRAPANTEVRRACRGSRPKGWIAIDYVADSTACGVPAMRRRAYSAALIISYEHIAIGESLEVCAAERIPSGWVKDRDVHDDPRCPHDEESSKPRVSVIRRVR